MTSVIFFGTHDFGAAMLEALLTTPDIQVLGVVTQPDRPVGRHHELTKSPVKLVAEQHNLPIWQPETLKGFIESASLPQVDVFVVCQYGLIIPKAVLDFPRKNTLNVHTSLLPKYRGASPIQTALMQGETKTGITIMLMDEKMDHGAILSQREVAIDPDDTYPTLSQKMIKPAQELLVECVTAWARDRVTAQPQDDAAATYCKLLDRDDGKLDFTKTAAELYNLYRGTYPWPGVWTTWQGKRLKLLNLRPTAKTMRAGIALIEQDKLFIGAGQGALEIIELQLEGKKALPAGQFIQGNKSIDGAAVGV